MSAEKKPRSGKNHLHTGTPSNCSPSLERISKLYNSIDINDSTKIWELREIEQEEFYIGKLREQRERLLEIKSEFDRRESIFKDIEDENHSLREKLAATNKIKLILNEQQKRNEELNYDIKRLTVEREIVEKENQKLKEELEERDITLMAFRDENEKFKEIINESENLILNLKNKINDKEKILADQMQNQIRQERDFKDKIMKMEYERKDLESQIHSLDSIRDQNVNLELELKKISQSLNNERHKNEKYELKVEEILEEKKFLIQEFENQKTVGLELKQEIHDLKAFSNKQEGVIAEFKQRKREEEKKIAKLKEELSNAEKNYEKSNSMRKDLSEEFNIMYRKVKDMEQEINYYSSENQELKTNLKKYIDKEENDKKYRSEIEKVKKDILSVRHNEVQKLTEAFDTILYQNSGIEGRASHPGVQTSDQRQKKQTTIDYSKRKYDTLKI